MIDLTSLVTQINIAVGLALIVFFLFVHFLFKFPEKKGSSRQR